MLCGSYPVTFGKLCKVEVKDITNSPKDRHAWPFNWWAAIYLSGDRDKHKHADDHDRLIAESPCHACKWSLSLTFGLRLSQQKFLRGEDWADQQGGSAHLYLMIFASPKWYANVSVRCAAKRLGFCGRPIRPWREYLIRISLFFVFWFGALFCWPLSCGLLRYHLEFVSWFHAKDDLPFYFRFFLSFWRGFSFLAVLVCVVIVRRFGSLILSANWFRHTIT